MVEKALLVPGKLSVVHGLAREASIWVDEDVLRTRFPLPQDVRAELALPDADFCTRATVTKALQQKTTSRTTARLPLVIDDHDDAANLLACSHQQRDEADVGALSTISGAHPRARGLDDPWWSVLGVRDSLIERRLAQPSGGAQRGSLFHS